MASWFPLVLTRYAEEGISKIRSQKFMDAKTYKALVGYDASSMYLH